MKAKCNRITIWLLLFALCFGLIPPQRALAVQDTIPTTTISVYDSDVAASVADYSDGSDSETIEDGLYRFPDGTVYYIKDGAISDFTGILSIYADQEYLIYLESGRWMHEYSGLYTYNNVKYVISQGIVDTSISGYYTYGKKTYVISQGMVDTSYTGIYLIGDSYQYISKGVFSTKTGLITQNGKKFYFKKGIYQPNYTGVKTFNSRKYYIQNGYVDTSTPTILKYKTRYYVVENGILKRTVSARCKKMLGLRKKYPEGKRWTNSDLYIWRAPGTVLTYGYGCAAFSFILSDTAYGKSARVVKHKRFTDVKSGDIIRMNYDSHSVVVLEKLSKGVIVAEGNYNSSIHWFRYITFSEIKKTGTYVQTRR